MYEWVMCAFSCAGDVLFKLTGSFTENLQILLINYFSTNYSTKEVDTMSDEK